MNENKSRIVFAFKSRDELLRYIESLSTSASLDDLAIFVSVSEKPSPKSWQILFHNVLSLSLQGELIKSTEDFLGKEMPFYEHLARARVKAEIRALRELPEYRYDIQYTWCYHPLAIAEYFGFGFHEEIAIAYQLMGIDFFLEHRMGKLTTAEEDPVLFRCGFLVCLSLKNVGLIEKARKELLSLYDRAFLAFAIRNCTNIKQYLEEMRQEILNVDTQAIQTLQQMIKELKGQIYTVREEVMVIKEQLQNLQYQILSVRKDYFNKIEKARRNGDEEAIEALFAAVSEEISKRISALTKVVSKDQLQRCQQELEEFWSFLHPKSKQDIAAAAYLVSQPEVSGLTELSVLELCRVLERESVERILLPFKTHNTELFTREISITEGSESRKRSLIRTHQSLWAFLKGKHVPTLGEIPFILRAIQDEYCCSNSPIVNSLARFHKMNIEILQSIVKILDSDDLFPPQKVRIVEVRNFVAHPEILRAKPLKVDIRIYEQVRTLLTSPPTQLLKLLFNLKG